MRIGWVKLRLRGKLKLLLLLLAPLHTVMLLQNSFKKKQQQFDALMGKVQAMVTTLQAQNAQATSSFHQGNPSLGMRGRGGCPFIVMVGGESLEVEALLHMVDGGAASTTEAQLPTKHYTSPARKGNVKTYTDNQCWQCGEMGHLKRSCPMLKGKGQLQGGNA